MSPTFLFAPVTLVSVGILLIVCGACEKPPPEIVGRDPKGSSPMSQGGQGGQAVAAAGSPASPVNQPVNLATATDGVPGTGALYADLDTEAGKLTCRLFDDKAPKAVANFVGLARGIQPFNDPMTHRWVKRPAYDGTTFHRVVKGFMIQGGDPSGSGKGDPGYVFDDEVWAGAKHDKAGLLCTANKGANTNGMQFFITDGAAAWLDGGYTIFGECSPIDAVHKLGSTPVRGETPVNKPRILKVTVRRS